MWENSFFIVSYPFSRTAVHSWSVGSCQGFNAVASEASAYNSASPVPHLREAILQLSEDFWVESSHPSSNSEHDKEKH